MNRGMRVLQTLALPLGYVTVYEKRSFRSDSHVGAGDEARTRYLDLGKVALYQMSYARRTGLIIPCVSAFVNPIFPIFLKLFR